MRILTTCPEAAAVATAFGIATLLPIAGIHPALAQQQSPVLTNVVPQAESITVRAKIASIDPQSREVTLVGRSGKPVTMHAGDEVRNLDKLKAGDIVDAEYKRSVAFELSGPNEKAPADEITKVVARPDQGLGGVGVRQTRISGLVTGVDQAAHTLEIVNPSGGEEHTIFVTDPARIAAMKSVKVGDTITAIVSEALAVSIEPAPAGSDEGQGRSDDGQGHGHR